MPDCLIDSESDGPCLPIYTVQADDYPTWLEAQPDVAKAWLESIGFEAKAGRSALMPGDDGQLAGAVLISRDPPSLWDFSRLHKALPATSWRLPTNIDDAGRQQAVLGWALAGYRFDRYKKSEAETCRLFLGDDPASAEARILAQAIYLGRDLINTPANDMGPEELEVAARDVADRYGAEVRTIEGDALLDENFPAVHTVGRASTRAPRVIDLTWGDASAPKLTLVGKGVCFDTGGLDLKSAAGMSLMKKDMGGAATMLATAQAVMALDLPVRLRLLIGAVENSVSGNAFRPGDVIQTRKGLSVEIGNTDAEGRLVLADLLALGDDEQPDLMIDCATLTGAARVALGADLPALFTPDDQLATDMLDAGLKAEDPLWRLPLHQPYREIIDSPIADINNAGVGGMAGTITAALFLKDFVTETSAWAHLDIYGWTPIAKPGRPKGGEATALRALVGLIKGRFGASA
ncbi:MAG: leucyl aminopeptidase family protein [Alphaproteobacteria bacterium]|nr:leucyl aminopeptidase family protein [Alphaproteobacteria bacterium]